MPLERGDVGDAMVRAPAVPASSSPRADASASSSFVDVREDVSRDDTDAVRAPSSPARSGSKLWGIARARVRDDADVARGRVRDALRDGEDAAAANKPARQGRRRMSTEYENYLRPILDRMPVKPERVSAVNGPLMNVTRIDDKTLDVKMTTSFRAHFGESLPSIGRRSLALPESEGDGQKIVAIGNSGWTDQNAGGVQISELDSGDFVPGRGGRYSVMTPEDSWGATELRAPSPAIGWYDDNETTSDSLQTEFLIDPEDVRLQERIAVGGFAEVFRGTWQGTVVAVKQLLERSSEVKTTLEREVEVLAKLRHPNLLLFMGYCVEPPLICTEFMRRGSLHTILKSGNVLEPARNHAVAIAVARGMSYLHSRSPPILHLDLKSPNILVDEKWRVKIADFGLARMRQTTQVSAKSEFHGTPEWMAPEMLRAEDFDERADSYSFGVVLWELLTARKPWMDLHPMQIVAVVGYSERKLELPPEGVPAADHDFTILLSDLFRACAQKDPTNRPLFPAILDALETARKRVAADGASAAAAAAPNPSERLGVQLEILDLAKDRASG